MNPGVVLLLLLFKFLSDDFNMNHWPELAFQRVKQEGIVLRPRYELVWMWYEAAWCPDLHMSDQQKQQDSHSSGSFPSRGHQLFAPHRQHCDSPWSQWKDSPWLQKTHLAQECFLSNVQLPWNEISCHLFCLNCSHCIGLLWDLIIQKQVTNTFLLRTQIFYFTGELIACKKKKSCCQSSLRIPGKLKKCQLTWCEQFFFLSFIPETTEW